MRDVRFLSRLFVCQFCVSTIARSKTGVAVPFTASSKAPSTVMSGTSVTVNFPASAYTFNGPSVRSLAEVSLRTVPRTE
jgi:hypothetical protein